MMTRAPSTGVSVVAPSYLRDDTIVVGLVNNMPDAALQATERQFCTLLAAAAGARPVELKLFSVPEVPRAEAARAHVAAHYQSVDALFGARIDGLIVTGTQPRSHDLTSEPYWSRLTDLVDWAEDDTLSSVWSCLAAHAAVRYLDDIQRQPFDDKLSGIFPCETSHEHSLAQGFPALWYVPQSRYYNLPPEPLLAHGYRVLSRSSRVGADLFVKQRKSLFVFCQGHLEYDRCSLMREYRADVTKFLCGERQTYPDMPCNYFDAETSAALTAFRARAEETRSLDLLESSPLTSVKDKLSHSWWSSALRLYQNWLSHLAEKKTLRTGMVTEVAAPAL
jgi:homoserine O-succinyltransferase